MPAGRPPKPIEQKRRNGNPGRRPLPPASSTTQITQHRDVPNPPTRLGAAGRKFWFQIWEAGSWLSVALDQPAVERCCRLISECRAYEKEIAQYGLMINQKNVTPLGEIFITRAPNPATKELRACEKQLGVWLAVLGFDPTARAKLGYTEIKARSKLEDLIERRQNSQSNNNAQ